MYKVPKLFLKGRYHDGRPLEWQDILKVLPAGLSNDSTKWTFLTYEEHPYLNMPWLALHPCGTSELMGMVFSTSTVGQVSAKSSLRTILAYEGNDCQYQGCTNVSLPLTTDLYNLAWLSFVSQAVAMKLPKEFSRCFASSGVSSSKVSCC
eukprot:c20528_g2_i2 orf=312-761(+)